jgi:hypothetical protein
MVNLLSLIFLLLSSSAMAAYQPACGVGSVSVGGACLSSTGLITLKCTITSGAQSVCYNVTPGVTPVAYTPSGATAFHGRAVKYSQFSAASATNMMGLYYSDNNIGPNSNTALTNPVSYTTSVTSLTAAGSSEYWLTANYNNAPVEYAVGGVVANGKYLNAVTGGAFGVIFVYGYEQ